MCSTRQCHKAAGVALFAVMFMALVACAGGESNAPTTSTTTPSTTTPSSSSSATPPPPTEKSINPTGGNLFSPPVKAPGPPTPAPGNLPGNH